MNALEPASWFVIASVFAGHIAAVEVCKSISRRADSKLVSFAPKKKKSRRCASCNGVGVVFVELLEHHCSPSYNTYN